MTDQKKNLLLEIEHVARSYFQDSSACHDWTHIERVRTLSKRIAKKENANVFIVEVATLLHDIGRSKEMKSHGKICHAEYGSILAGRICVKMGMRPNEVENIVHCVLSHRWRNGHIPETLEAKCLFDADKLDSIGAVGVARDFLFAGYVGTKVPKLLYTGNEKELAKTGTDYSYTENDTAILEYEVKLKYIKKKMMTREGKRIAYERDAFMKEYFSRFWKEVRAQL